MNTIFWWPNLNIARANSDLSCGISRSTNAGYNYINRWIWDDARNGLAIKNCFEQHPNTGPCQNKCLLHVIMPLVKIEIFEEASSNKCDQQSILKIVEKCSITMGKQSTHFCEKVLGRGLAAFCSETYCDGFEIKRERVTPVNDVNDSEETQSSLGRILFHRENMCPIFYTKGIMDVSVAGQCPVTESQDQEDTNEVGDANDTEDTNDTTDTSDTEDTNDTGDSEDASNTVEPVELTTQQKLLEACLRSQDIATTLLLDYISSYSVEESLFVNEGDSVDPVLDRTMSVIKSCDSDGYQICCSSGELNVESILGVYSGTGFCSDTGGPKATNTDLQVYSVTTKKFQELSGWLSLNRSTTETENNQIEVFYKEIAENKVTGEYAELFTNVGDISWGEDVYGALVPDFTEDLVQVSNRGRSQSIVKMVPYSPKGISINLVPLGMEIYWENPPDVQRLIPSRYYTPPEKRGPNVEEEDDGGGEEGEEGEEESVGLYLNSDEEDESLTFQVTSINSPESLVVMIFDDKIEEKELEAFYLKSQTNATKVTCQYEKGKDVCITCENSPDSDFTILHRQSKKKGITFHLVKNLNQIYIPDIYPGRTYTVVLQYLHGTRRSQCREITQPLPRKKSKASLKEDDNENK